MSHFQQIRTTRQSLIALHSALVRRGYTPIPIIGEAEVSLDECTALRLHPDDILEDNEWDIVFQKEDDGQIATVANYRVFNTGEGVDPTLVNRAGHGVNWSFEAEIIPEYAIEATLLLMAEQGFDCDRDSIHVEGDTVVVVGTKDSTTTFRPSSEVAASSNLVVI